MIIGVKVRRDKAQTSLGRLLLELESGCELRGPRIDLILICTSARFFFCVLVGACFVFASSCYSYTTTTRNGIYCSYNCRTSLTTNITDPHAKGVEHHFRRN